MSQEVRWNQSLAWKIFLRSSLTILLIIVSLVWATTALANRKARESAVSQMISSSQIVDEALEQQGRTMDAGLEVFTQLSANQVSIEKGDYEDVRSTLLGNLWRLSSEIAVVVRPTGALLSCTTDGAKTDYRDVAIVQMAMHPEQAQAAGKAGPSYRGFLEIKEGKFKGVYHAVARPLFSSAGVSTGAMLVGNRLSDGAAAALRKVALPKGGEREAQPQFGLLSHFGLDGSTIADPQARAALQEAIMFGAGFKSAQKAVRSGGRSGTVPVSLQGHSYLAILAPLNGVQAHELGVADVVLMPLDPFLAPFIAIRNVILLAGAVGLLLALILSLGFSRAVTSPLSALAHAAAQLAAGECPEIPALNGHDEVGRLTQAFRAMFAELRAKDELLAALEQLGAADATLPGMNGGSPAKDEGILALSSVDVDATVVLRENLSAPGFAPPLEGQKRLSLKKGDVFAGRYRIESVVGKGGMGIVLKAYDQQLDEEVALKIIRPGHDVSDGFMEQLKQEIKLARKITHKYVLRTHDFSTVGGLPFISMEYLKGVTLKKLLDAQGVLPLGLVLRIGRQVAEGLEAAHSEGVVHRDIKPMNILFDARGDAKIMDFGLAAPVAAKGTTDAGQIFGTPRYMAPEQVKGERVDPRTDLYALGVMLFELATGFAPFEHASNLELLRMHLSTPAPRARDLTPDMPEAFSSLLERLMAKRMEDRPATAQEVAELLKQLAPEIEKPMRGV